ncbi:unnamed protein product [Camellia sinensis]
MILIPVSLATIGGTTSLCHPPTGVALLRRRHRPTDDHSSRRCSKSRSELYEDFRLFMFLVFHAICVVIVKSYSPSSTDVLDPFLPVLHFRYGVEEEHTEYTDSTYEEQSSQHGSKYNDNYNDDDDKNDDVYYHGSDGYDEENDDNGSDGVVG